MLKNFHEDRVLWAERKLRRDQREAEEAARAQQQQQMQEKHPDLGDEDEFHDQNQAFHHKYR